MQRQPLRIACISGWPSDSEWVWLKDKLNYEHPIDWRFFNPPPAGRIDKLLGRPLFGRMLVGLRLRRAVRRGEIDLIVSHLPYCTSWAATLLGRAKGKVFHLAFAFNFTDLPTGISRWHMAQSFQRVDHFVVFSTMEKQLYGQYFGIPAVKFERMAWGVNPPIDIPGPRKVDGAYVISMGGEARDYPTLVEVARAMKETTFILIVREWSLSGLQLPPNIKVFTNIPWTDAWSLVYYSALAVIPLRSSTTPNGHVTLIGGMHMGKAHVVTASRGLADYVTHNENALTVPPGDAAAMQHAITSLLSKPELAERLGNAAKIFAKKNCSEEVTSVFFAEFLERVFPEGPSSPD